MGKTAGGIFKQGAGCAGCGGLGAMTTGIFAAPTALGTELFQRHNRGLRGLGAITVPAACWNFPSFTQASQNCLSQAQVTCNYEDGCTEVENDKCLQSFIDSTGCGGAAPVAVPSGACNSAPVISAVQSQINTTVDGKWGTNSQAALTKSGKTYAQLAPGCTGSAPSAGGGGTVYVPPVTTPPVTTPPVVAPPAPQQAGIMGFVTSKFWGLPMYAWLALGGGAIYVGMKMARGDSPSYGGGYDTY